MFLRFWIAADTRLQSTSSTKKIHAAVVSEVFKNLEDVNISLFEIELAKAQIEHKEPIKVESFLFNMHNYECRNCSIMLSPITKT